MQAASVIAMQLMNESYTIVLLYLSSPQTCFPFLTRTKSKKIEKYIKNTFNYIFKSRTHVDIFISSVTLKV